MPISLNEFKKGEEKFVRVQGLSFRGSVLDLVPTDKAITAEEVHAEINKVEAFADKKLAHTRTALNNLLRDEKIARRYVENKAYYTKSGVEAKTEEKEEPEDEE